MTKFEYKTTVCGYVYLEEHLNKKGEKGWEAINIAEIMDFGELKYEIIFKRIKEV